MSAFEVINDGMDGISDDLESAVQQLKIEAATLRGALDEIRNLIFRSNSTEAKIIDMPNPLRKVN
jgi:hypothetical protein